MSACTVGRDGHVVTIGAARLLTARPHGRIAMKQALRRLTAEEFAALGPYIAHLAPARRDAVEKVLVHGLSMAQAAGEEFSRQNVHEAVHLVLRIAEGRQVHQRYAARAESGRVPSGWREVTLIAPVALIPRLERMVADAAAAAEEEAAARKVARRTAAAQAGDATSSDDVTAVAKKKTRRA